MESARINHSNYTIKSGGKPLHKARLIQVRPASSPFVAEGLRTEDLAAGGFFPAICSASSVNRSISACTSSCASASSCELAFCGTLIGRPLNAYTVVNGLGTITSVQLPRIFHERRAQNAVGTMDRPECEAINTNPIFVVRHGPRGPSGVTTKCVFIGRRSKSRIAVAPFRPLEPRTRPMPSICKPYARWEPSKCLLTKATVRKWRSREHGESDRFVPHAENESFRACRIVRIRVGRPQVIAYAERAKRIRHAVTTLIASNQFSHRLRIFTKCFHNHRNL